MGHHLCPWWSPFLSLLLTEGWGLSSPYDLKWVKTRQWEDIAEQVGVFVPITCEMASVDTHKNARWGGEVSLHLWRYSCVCNAWDMQRQRHDGRGWENQYSCSEYLETEGPGKSHLTMNLRESLFCSFRKTVGPIGWLLSWRASTKPGDSWMSSLRSGWTGWRTHQHSCPEALTSPGQ